MRAGGRITSLLNVHRVNDVKQIHMYTAAPLVPKPSPFEVEIAIAKLKCKSPGVDRIPAQLIQAGGDILPSKIHHSLTQGAEPFLRSCQLCSCSRTSQHLMEPEGSEGTVFTRALHWSLT
jgi:hypothetical protein